MVSFSQTNNEESNSQTLKNDALMKDIIGYIFGYMVFIL